MKKWKLILSHFGVAVVAATLAVALTLGLTVGNAPVVPGSSKLEQLENLLIQRFIGEADQTAMEDAAASAMVEALGDRWSYYIPASQYGDYEEQKENAYVGIGVTITAAGEGQGLEIQKVTPGGSAEEAGLLAGDLIVAVNGESILDKTTDEVKALVRGEAGTTVDIGVRRGEQERTFTVTRRQILTPVATGTLLEQNVGLVTIANFNEHCAEQSIAAIEDLMKQGADKLIFDVRFNPGGYARELVELLDYILPEGPIFRTEDYQGNQNVDNSDARCLELPMAVLVNGSSYSAAEFFAVALSEYEVAAVVGEQTCGKGYFQNVYTLKDGSAVGLSIGKYYTPKGRNLAEVGITPDVQVPVDEETAAAIYAGTLPPAEDPQILAAISALCSEN